MANSPKVQQIVDGITVEVKSFDWFECHHCGQRGLGSIYRLQTADGRTLGLITDCANTMRQEPSRYLVDGLLIMERNG